jgi:hypothetical protein
MSKEIWNQQADKWHKVGLDWQGQANIFDVELELELLRCATG